MSHLKHNDTFLKHNDILFELAQKAMSKAYVPYSCFQVGAAILTKTGKFYSGCNVENAAYPEGTCAEAGAIAAMVLDGETQIQDIYVIGNGGGLVTPCGGCRQKIREFSSADTMIHICGVEGIRKSLTMNELLPFSFGPENLESRNLEPSNLEQSNLEQKKTA